MLNNKNQIAVIVGGTSGLGLGAAKIFAANSFKVIVGSHSKVKVGKISETIPQAQAFELDVTNDASVEKFFKDVGTFNHLVITASSAFTDKPLNEMSIDELKTFTETKLWGAVRCVKAGKNYIASGGSITFISGALSQKGRSGAHAKAITNGALESLTRSLAVELAPEIRVNCVSPGIFDSKGIMTPERKEEIARLYPSHYVGNSEDVGSMIYATATNSFMTGSVVYIDGGWTVG